MRYTRRNIKYNTNAGFTLVEMIVVLVILGILASVAVYSIIGYINRTRYNNNQQNAESIYQSAQATLNHMSENGTINDWAKSLIGSKGMTGADGSENGIGVPDGYNPSNVDIPGSLDNTYNQRFFETLQDKTDKMPGQSAHMRYAVTYTPVDDSLKDQNDFIWELLSPDFKSTDIFSGIITIEFDVEKVLDSTNTPRYSASVYSVFYDSRSSSWDTSSHKWNSTALKSYSTSEDGSSANNSPVPYRSEDYRSSTSLVGYYAGRGIMSAVDSVYLPPEAKINNFTLRNGETLDLNWSLTSEDGTPITGIPSHIHYTFSLYDEACKDTYPANKICDIVVNENSILEGIPSESLYSDKVTTDDKVSYPNSIYNKFESLFESKFQDASDKTLFNEGLFIPGNVEKIKLNTPTNIGNGNERTYTIVYSRDYITDVSGIEMTVYKASFMTNTDVYVHMVAADNNYAFDYNKPEANVLGEANYYRFPLTVTYECYVIKNAGQNNNQNYGTIVSKGITYSLSLDAMMSRNVIDSIDDKPDPKNAEEVEAVAIAERIDNYSINRILNKTATYLEYNIMPTNIYAEMVVDNDADFSETYNKDYKGYSLQEQVKASAQRAYNDPVYLRADGKYYYEKNKAGYDTTEHAVVNSYFGDLDEGSFGTHPNITSTEKAVITSFRHLYNIRMLESYNVDVCYYIKRDLNWFTIKKDEETGKETYSSNVIVFSPINDTIIANLRTLENSKGSSEIAINEYFNNSDNSGLHAFSPVPIPLSDGTPNNPHPYYGDSLNVVSFPSIKYFNAHSTLIADKNSQLNLNNDEYITSVINNVQMRNASFFDKDEVSMNLNGYGLINVNYGAVINIRINCFTVVLNNARDGSPDDRDDISEGINELITHSIGTDEDPNVKIQGTSPISALIGANGGTVGDKDNIYNTPNIVRASNCVVTTIHQTNEGWKLYKVSAVSCIIGDHGTSKTDTTPKLDGYAYGQLEATGHFAVAGWINAGGAIGYSRSNIDATILVDNTVVGNDTAYIDFGYVNNNAQKPINSVIYATADTAGGALGKMDENRHFCPNVSSLNYIDYGNGRFDIAENSDAVYSIRVKLDSGSYIVIRDKSAPKKDEQKGGVGGAVGRMKYSGTLSIFVLNDGTISTSYQNGNHQYVQNLGGAVGTIYDSNISGINIYVVNNGNLGSYGDDNPEICSNSTGGAIGRIQDSTTDGTEINISVVNKGAIFGDFSRINNIENYGVGGAIGSIKCTYDNLTNYHVRCDNYKSISGKTKTQAGDNGNNHFGVGGVIGYVQYMPHNSAFYSIMEENSSVHSDGNNAGGVIGAQSGKPVTINNEATTIVTDFRNGSSITASGSNAGGSVGHLGDFYGKTQVNTKVSGVVQIEALSDAGGVCGRLHTSTTTINASIILEGDTYAELDINAKGESTSTYKNNAGGLIGVCFVSDGTVDFIPKLKLPTQTGNDVLIIKVDSYDNAGGMIGYYKNNKQDLAISEGLTVTLHPESHVYARNDNAGGCFGKFESDKELNTNIYVCNASINSTSVPYIWADGKNAGGCIGYSNNAVKLKEDYSITVSTTTGLKIKGGTYNADNDTYIGGNTGGCIGNIEGSAEIEGTVYIDGKYFEIAGFDNTGGIIGRCHNIAIRETGYIYSNAEKVTISGKTNTGGVIGNCSRTTISGNISYGVISVDPITGTSSTSTKEVKISGQNNTGGAIGSCSGSYIYGTIAYRTMIPATLTEAVKGTENTGGCIGYLSGGYFDGDSIIEFSGENSEINGNSYTGGCIGQIKNCTDIYGKILFSGSGNKIAGSSNYTGGVAGAIVSSTTKEKTSITFSGNNQIKGVDYTGGVVGYINGGEFHNNSSFKFSADNSTISGNNYIGGVIGGTNGGYFKNNSSYKFTATDTTISGVNYIGGVIGYLRKTEMNNTGTHDGVTEHILLEYSGKRTTDDISIYGSNNSIGGIIGGMVESAWSKDGTQYEFKGTNIYIKGNEDIGGIIGSSVGSSNRASILFSPITACTIEGNNNVAGCVGRASGNRGNGADNANLPNNPTINISGCSLLISGKGYTGGIVGRLESGCWFSGSTVTLSGTDVKLTIISSNSAAGGHIGYMIGVNMGNVNNILATTCNDNAKIIVKGKDSAGGVIGFINNEYKVSKPTIKFTLNGTSSITISATDENANVGGIIGVNGSEFGHSGDVVYSGTGLITINVPTSGYIGAYIGKNDRKFNGSAYNTYQDYLDHVYFGNTVANKLIGNGTY